VLYRHSAPVLSNISLFIFIWILYCNRIDSKHVTLIVRSLASIIAVRNSTVGCRMLFWRDLLSFILKHSRQITRYFKKNRPLFSSNVLSAFVSLLRDRHGAFCGNHPVFWCSSVWLWQEVLNVTTCRWQLIRMWYKEDGVLSNASQNRTPISIVKRTGSAQVYWSFLAPCTAVYFPKQSDRHCREKHVPTHSTL
jgi:hypothetical protein